MLTFNGQNLLCFHHGTKAERPELHAQRNHFAGVWGESVIILGTGGRAITIDVILSDTSFTTAAAVDAYRQQFDLSVGTVANLQVTDSAGHQLAYFADVTFEGYSPTEMPKQALGTGFGSFLQPGTYYQPGVLHFRQNSVP